MNRELIINLIYNITALLTLVMIYTAFHDRMQIGRISHKILMGLCGGFAGVVIMTTAVQFGGAIFDARSVLLSVMGLFFGLIPTAIAGGMMALYRIWIGGAGVYTGVLVIVTTSAIGILWNRYRFKEISKLQNPRYMEFYLFGLLVHVDMLLCMLALPKEQMENILRNITLPVLILYPIATYLLCKLLLNQFIKSDLEAQLRQREEQYRELAETISDVLWTCDLNFNLLYVSPSVEKLIGDPKEAYMKRPIEEKFSSEDLTKMHKLLEEEFKKEEDPGSDPGRSRMIEMKHLKPDGTWLWISMHISFMRNEQGQIIGMRGTTRGINERKMAEEEKAKQEALVLSLLDSIPDLIFYKDMNSVYIGCNKTFSQFVGKPVDEIVGKTDYDLVDRQTADIFTFNDKEMLKSKQPRRNEEWVVYPNGERVLLDTLKTPYCGLDGEIIGTLGVSRDITERNQKEEEISYIGYHDYLTGLNNRRCFEEKKKRLDAQEYLPLTVIFADMDGLKLINDGFGYANGDKLLIEAAEILKKCCRASDVVFRIGGDEFCILLPKANGETARKLVKRIRMMCDNTVIDLGGSSVKPSISLGYDTKTRTEQNLSDMIGNAENLMRRSKLLQRKNVRSDLLSTIKATMLENSQEAADHAERLVRLALALGEELNLSEERLLKLELAAALHDIGTTSIDNRILSKQEKLTQDDWAEIRKHPEAGYRIAQATSELIPISEYILSHHERWDGKGYPQGLKGEQIPLIARIISLVDSYDAMTEDRPYRAAMTQQEAISGILRNAGTQFDPKIVKIFIEKIVKPGKC